MNSGLGVVIGALLIAGSIAFSGRYTLVATSGDENLGYSYAWRVDRWTGKMWLCANWWKSGGGSECHHYPRMDVDYPRR
jgi:hypothetical protein